MSPYRQTFCMVGAALSVMLIAALGFGRPGPISRQTANTAAASASSSSGAAAPTTPSSGPERARRGVVVIERAGHALSLGMVLAGDGRVLSALSPLGDGNAIDARYADGSVVNLRVGHSNRTWDLALLIPQVGRWPEGLTASSGDPLRLGSRIRAFTQVRGHPMLASVVIKGRTSLLGGDGELLRDVLEITTRVPPTDLGTPLVDEEGHVIGLLSRGCSAAQGDAGTCHPITYGAPVEALRQFLRSAPANAIPPAPWLGIQGTATATPVARGVRVVMVHPESPAHEAGLRAGTEATADTIVAIDGVPVPTPEKLAEVVRSHAVRDKVDVIVQRDGKFRVIPVTLRAAPAARPAGSGPSPSP